MPQRREKVEELDILLKKVTVKFMIIVTGVFFIFFIFFGYEKLYPYNYLTAIYFIIHLILLFIPIRLEYKSIKLLIPIYLGSISLFLYPIVLFLWMINQVTAFMWFFIFPVGTMVFFQTRTVAFWTIYILFEVLSIFILSNIIPYNPGTHFTGNQLAIMNIMTISSCLTLISFFIYYINKSNQIKIQNSQSEDKDKEEESSEKYEELYNNILNYFKYEKPYCNPDFTINQLADAMDTNITYISKAININKGTNFNLFTNSYRIKMVKDMLSNGYQDKYTIKFIYISSGFKHQSTFNKAFKQIEGITPSEYIKKRQPSSNEKDTQDDHSQ